MWFIREKKIYQHICQVWCLYHKTNNLFDMLSYAAPLYSNRDTTEQKLAAENSMSNSMSKINDMGI